MKNETDFDVNIKLKFGYIPSHQKRMLIEKSSSTLLIDSTLHSDMFNIVCGAKNNQELDDNINYFKSKKCPFAFWVGFKNDPAWLEGGLINRGFISDEIEWAMVADLKNFKFKNDGSIRKVTTPQMVQDLVKVMIGILPKHEHKAIETFYLEATDIILEKGCPLAFFIGYVDGKPISLSSSFCDDVVGSVFDVIVLPEMRGKGWGKSMTRTAMAEIQARGLTHSILTATNDAKFLYQKLGFKDFKIMKVYRLP